MATITLNIKDEYIGRVVNALAYGNGYTDTVAQNPADPNSPQVPNPVSKNAFAKEQLFEYMKRYTIRYEREKAEREARQEVEAELGGVDLET